MISQEKLNRMRNAAHLIEPPCARVVGELADEIESLRQQLAEKDAEIKLLRESIEAGTPVAKRRLAEIERLKGLLSVAKCPACNGSGAIQDEWGGYQCQWCAEKEQALNSKGGSDD